MHCNAVLNQGGQPDRRELCSPLRRLRTSRTPRFPSGGCTTGTAASTLSVRILKSHNRAWQLYAERWDNGKWALIERVVPGEARSQALAYCLAGAFIERMYQNTGALGDD